MSTDLYVHARLPGKPGGPLLFTFHGTGGDEHQFSDLGRVLASDATIVSPRGDVAEHGAARFFRRTAEGAYDLVDLARATTKMARFVDAHRLAAGGSSVFGLGYSNGANILASIVFARPDLFDRMMLMHPLIPFAPAISGAIEGEVLITAGRRDPICPPALTGRLADSMRTAGANVDLQWHEGGHEIRQSEIEAARQFMARQAQPIRTGV